MLARQFKIMQRLNGNAELLTTAYGINEREALQEKLGVKVRIGTIHKHDFITTEVNLYSIPRYWKIIH